MNFRTAAVSPKQAHILDRNLNKTKNAEISLSAYAFLLGEMLQYSQKNVKGIQELEKKLGDLGYRVGARLVELQVWREKYPKRDTKLLQALQFVHTNLWMSLFSKKADALERSTENEDEYMISDNDPLLSKYISVPKELSSFNPGSFVAGIVEAVFDGMKMAAKVSAHSTRTDQHPTRTTYLIKFDMTVMQREKQTKD